jgi:hypothetical protein
MEETNISLSQRENYTPTKWNKFLWWLSTVEYELIKDCVVDRNRFSIVGYSVLTTWIFACFAWTYFFYTASKSLVFALVPGLFMGIVILTIDRTLIKGIQPFKKNKFVPFLLRSVLALLIGMFMAQPAIMYLFKKEINLQISLDNEGRKIAKRKELDSLYKNQKTVLLNNKENIEQVLIKKNEEVTQARKSYLSETDGTGGSGKIGLKSIAQAKKNEYDKLYSDNQLVHEKYKPQLISIDSSLNAIEKNIHQNEKQFELLLNDGFLTQATALQNLLKDNSALQFRYFLIVFIFMLIELMPVISKSILPIGTYAIKAREVEEREKEIAIENIEKDFKLKQKYNSISHEMNEDFINNFFQKTQAEKDIKLSEDLKTWKENKNQSFDSFWNNLKKGYLSKQEN